MSEPAPNGYTDISYLNGANATYLDALFQQYQDNPDSVSEHWRNVFESIPELEQDEASDSTLVVTGSRDWVKSAFYKQAQVIQLIDNYRRLSHLVADVDPLGTMKRINPKEISLEQYGLSEADMDSVFDSGNLGQGGRKTLREILSYTKKPTVNRSVMNTVISPMPSNANGYDNKSKPTLFARSNQIKRELIFCISSPPLKFSNNICIRSTSARNVFPLRVEMH